MISDLATKMPLVEPDFFREGGGCSQANFNKLKGLSKSSGYKEVQVR